MMLGRILLVVIFTVSAVGTAVADLGFMHASNEGWPPHAKLHAVWGVFHVLATHTVGATLLLWQFTVTKARIAVAILLSYTLSFFVAWMVAPQFGGALAPDIAAEKLEASQRMGIDGNLLSFLVMVPLVLIGWWLCERAVPARLSA